MYFGPRIVMHLNTHTLDSDSLDRICNSRPDPYHTTTYKVAQFWKWSSTVNCLVLVMRLWQEKERGLDRWNHSGTAMPSLSHRSFSDFFFSLARSCFWPAHNLIFDWILIEMKWRATARYYASLTKTNVTTRKSVPRSCRQSDHTKTWPSQRDANCSHVDRSPVHQVWPKTILQGTVTGGRRLGRQRKRWEDNIRKWTGLEFAKSQWRTGKMEETACEIICGAPTTLAVKGLMMMMMN